MSDEQTTIAWTAIETHWTVLSSDGEEIGDVYAVVGDRQADIFNGLALTRRGGPALVHEVVDKPRYVASEQVASIRPGVVVLRLTAEAAERLPEHDAAESLRILPDEASLGERLRRRRDPGAGDRDED
ncbi:MAG: hypothetical protein JW767_07905 [Thermoleophilia bacterium]|nr:hypothetical protein [Thermoleophilia bacterium]